MVRKSIWHKKASELSEKDRKLVNKVRNDYRKNAYKKFQICINKEKYPEILQKFSEVENVTEYIKQLILDDIENNG